MNKRIKNKKAKQYTQQQIDIFLCWVKNGNLSIKENDIICVKNQVGVIGGISPNGFSLEDSRAGDKNWQRLATRLPNESTESFIKRCSIKLSQSELQ